MIAEYNSANVLMSRWSDTKAPEPPTAAGSPATSAAHETQSFALDVAAVPPIMLVAADGRISVLVTREMVVR